MNHIYLDHNSTTPVAPQVMDAMRPYFDVTFGNASSLHGPGQKARMAVDDARRTMAALLDCQSSEIIFTSGGTEADNMALAGVARAHGFRGHMVVSAIEHKATLETADMLEEMGMRISRVPAGRDGIVDPSGMIEAFEKDTVLVSLMLANNETGVIQPVGEVAAQARSRGITVHCDTVQGLGKVPFDLNELGVDLAAFSAHKIHGPKGVGMLYHRFGTRLAPLINGGRQEYGKRGGSANVPGIVGFAEAARIATSEQDALAVRLRSMTHSFVHRLSEQLGGVSLNGHPVQRLPGTVNLAFSGLNGASLVQALDMAGIAASPGSACQSGAAEPSHVLAAMGLSDEVARGSVRFSFGPINDEEQMGRAVEIVVRTVERMQS